MTSVRRLLCPLLLAIGSLPALAAPPAVEGAWARATPPAARTGAVYLTVTAAAADRLLGATSPAARVVEIHTHVEEGGLSRMERLPELALPEGVGVRLEPGGLHLMLIDLAGPLVAGESLELRLDFAAAGRIDLVVPVLDARASGPDRAPHDHGAHHTP
jgi:copper(I)-binding protein